MVRGEGAKVADKDGGTPGENLKVGYDKRLSGKTLKAGVFGDLQDTKNDPKPVDCSDPAQARSTSSPGMGASSNAEMDPTHGNPSIVNHEDPCHAMNSSGRPRRDEDVPKVRRLSSEAYRPWGSRSSNASPDPDPAPQDRTSCRGGPNNLVCDTEVKDGDMGVQCCTCKHWFHSKCQGIPKAAYNALVKHKVLSWHCSSCNPELQLRGKSDEEGRASNLESKVDALISLVQTTLEEIKQTNNQLSEKMKNDAKQMREGLEGRMEKVENVMRAQVKLISDQENMLQSSFQKIQDVKLSYAEAVRNSADVMQNVMKKFEDIPPQVKEKPGLSTEKAIAGIFDDFLDKEKRKLNVVMHNIPESTGETYADRVQADKSMFREVVRDSMYLNVKVTKAYRVGKPTQGRPRLLIVGLENGEVKAEILKLAPQLRASDKWRDVYISPDLSWKEREEGRRLREELRRRTSAGEVNLIIRRGRVISKGNQDHSKPPTEETQEAEDALLHRAGHSETAPAQDHSSQHDHSVTQRVGNRTPSNRISPLEQGQY